MKSFENGKQMFKLQNKPLVTYNQTPNYLSANLKNETQQAYVV